jgi:hypothetical protein
MAAHELQHTCTLKPLNPRLKPLQITLTGQTVFRLGRHDHCEQSFPTDFRISGVHCSLRLEANQFVVVDSSVNGTYVNGIRVPQRSPQVLHNGDQIFLVIPDDALLTSGYTGSLTQNFVGYLFEQHEEAPNDPQADDARKVLRKGFLEKLPVSSPFGSWQRRWLVLRSDCIEWHGSEASKEPKGKMALARGATATLDSEVAPTLLYVRPPQRKPLLTLRAPSTLSDGHEKSRTLTAWQAAIQILIDEAASKEAGKGEAPPDPAAKARALRGATSAQHRQSGAALGARGPLPAPAVATAAVHAANAEVGDAAAPPISFAAWWFTNLANGADHELLAVPVEAQ